MKTLESMTKEERNQLLYFETRAVDYAGRVDVLQMNADDLAITHRWHAEGFVGFGRVAFEHITKEGAHWCWLSDEAFALAHAERKVRAQRTWAKRAWWTTEEKRAA